MKLLKGSFLLKLSALIVAISAYFYIHRQIELTEADHGMDRETAICQKPCCQK